MKREQIKKTSTLFFAIVTVAALFAVNLATTSQNVSATVIVHHEVVVHHNHKAVVHHKAHTASKDSSGASTIHKVVAVIPETHGKVLNATALKKLTKGPDGNSIVIGGMTVDGY